MKMHPYVSESEPKTSLRPSRRTIKRVAPAVDSVSPVPPISVTTTSSPAPTCRRPTMPTSRPTRPSSHRKSPATFPRCWLQTTRP
jgi:hypothetical protein